MSGFNKMSNTAAMSYNEVVAKGGALSKIGALVREEIADIKQDYKEGGLKKAVMGHIERQADMKTLVDVALVFGAIAYGIVAKDPNAALATYILSGRAGMNQGEKLAVKKYSGR